MLTHHFLPLYQGGGCNSRIFMPQTSVFKAGAFLFTSAGKQTCWLVL